MLSYITSGKYAESLSDETARAFGRLWTGKADEGVLTGNNTQGSPLLETSGKNELKDSLEKAISESPESRRAFAEVLQAAPVYTSEKLVQWEKKGNGYIDSVVGFWNEKYGGTVEHNGRKVLLTKETYKDSLAHTKAANKFWFAAFAAVPEVIRNGSTILQQSDWKGRGYNTETIGAMIKLNADDETLALVVVDHYPNGVSRAYLHKIVAKENLRQLKTRLVTGTGDNSTIASDSNSVKGAEFELAEDTPSMAEVRRKYEGTDKWMKAPNGEQTRLDERQWLQVRTPEFKRWFGDWEKAADYEWLMSSEPVTNLTGEELSTGMVEGANSFFETKYGGKVYRDGIGTIMLTRRGINSSIAHGVGRLKAAAFIAVPDVIAKGRVFGITENYKGRGYTSIVIDAPIRIGEKEYVCEVVVNKKGPSGVFYLHEVEVKEKLSVGNQVRAYNGQGQMRNANGKASRLIVSKLAAEGNFNSSKVLDENGEPMVVDGVFLSLDSDAVLRKIQARKLQAEVLAGRIRDAERDSGARYGTMDFAYANPEVSEDIALGADDVRLLAEAIYKGNAPELVVGFRYGDIPKAMMSYNHRDQYLEAGVSIVGRVRDLDKEIRLLRNAFGK